MAIIYLIFPLLKKFLRPTPGVLQASRTLCSLYLVLLRMRFVNPGDCSPDGRLLPCRFTFDLIFSQDRLLFCDTFCRNLSCPGFLPASPLLWSPDFPHIPKTLVFADSAIAYNRTEILFFKEPANAV